MALPQGYSPSGHALVKILFSDPSYNMVLEIRNISPVGRLGRGTVEREFGYLQFFDVDLSGLHFSERISGILLGELSLQGFSEPLCVSRSERKVSQGLGKIEVKA